MSKLLILCPHSLLSSSLPSSLSLHPLSILPLSPFSLHPPSSPSLHLPSSLSTSLSLLLSLSTSPPLSLSLYLLSLSTSSLSLFPAMQFGQLLTHLDTTQQMINNSLKDNGTLLTQVRLLPIGQTGQVRAAYWSDWLFKSTM